jgi:hypothetical protein
MRGTSGTSPHDEYLGVLDAVSDTSFEEPFGPDLKRVTNHKHAIEAGRGVRSLAVVRAQGRPRLRVNRWGKLQLELTYPDTPSYMSVTDVRFYESDHTTVKHELVNDIDRRLGAGVGAFIMLGLGRAFVANDDDRSRHWLQANGMCLFDRSVDDMP